ncbi:MAG: MFS transporter [Steroidobacter sp.]
MNNKDQHTVPSSKSVWLNSTVIGIGLASLFSDWSHEIATALLPAFLASMGSAAAWLGIIEGVADGVSSVMKMGSGYYTDRLQRRKGIAVAGYVVTAMGTAAFGLATSAWQVLLARTAAWLGRGVRTPVRKALLAGAVTRETYGRAFGFERMMDTLGAIVGPLTALLLLNWFDHHYSTVFALTLIPGLIAALCIAVLVKEKTRVAVKHISFGESLGALPPRYKNFLLAVGVFGMGDFAHSMLILLAVQVLTPLHGVTAAVATATVLYVVHNIVYAGFSIIAGWMADRFNKGPLLVVAYLLAAIMAAMIVFVHLNMLTLIMVFVLAGMFVAMEETLEDSFCAELVESSHHGMAFGVLATVNGVGDFVSSTVVGLLWSSMGIAVAFGFSAVLFVAGAMLTLRVVRAGHVQPATG